MRFAKLFRPLFLVALGLHALALLLPMGGASKTAEVEIAEETVLAEAPSLADTVPRKLPVPDPNAIAGGAATSAVSAQVAPAARPGGATATRSVPLALATVPNAAAARARPSTVVASSAPQVPTASVRSLESSNDFSNGTTASSSPPLGLPTIAAAETSDMAAVEPPANETAGNDGLQTLDAPTQPNRSASSQALIASAIGQLPDSLKALMNRWAIALTYSSKGTSDRHAKAALSRWTDKINAQASGIPLDRQILEAVQVENFARLSYPIESSVRDGAVSPPENREQSFRVCLEQPPSTPAEVGVLFDAQGDVADELELIRSTGYKAIDDEAIALVEAAKTWPDDRGSKAFVFEVAIDYDKEACAKLEDLKD